MVGTGSLERSALAPTGRSARRKRPELVVTVAEALLAIGAFAGAAGLITVLGIWSRRASQPAAETPRTARDTARRRRVRRWQRWVLNPPMKAATWLGLVPGHVLLETIGRVSRRRRRNVVGMHIEGATGWVVAEQGRYAGYVRNLEADPHVRVRVRRRWCAATAMIDDDDDVQERLDTFATSRHAAAVRRFGTDLLTVRVDVAPETD